MKTLVVGIGSFNGNDEIGWSIVDALKNESSNKDFSYFKSKSDGSDWYHEIKNHQEIVFIDAMLSDKPVGSIIELSIEDIQNNNTLCKGSSHEISLQDSILMAKNLDLLHIPVRIFGIAIKKDTTLLLPISEITSRFIDILCLSHKTTL